MDKISKTTNIYSNIVANGFATEVSVDRSKFQETDRILCMVRKRCVSNCIDEPRIGKTVVTREIKHSNNFKIISVTLNMLENIYELQ